MTFWGNISIKVRSLMICFYLVSKSLLRHRRRSLNMLLGFLIGSALISAFFVWENTALSFAIQDAFGERDFELKIQSFSDTESSHLLDQIKGWLKNETIVEKSFVVYKAPAVFGSENLSDSYQYYPNNETPILITNPDGVRFVDEGFSETIAHQFRVTGSFSLQRGQLLMSKSLAQKVELIVQRPLTAGSKLNFAYGLRSEPMKSQKFLGDLQRTFIFNVTITGIFQRIPRPNLSRLEFNPETLAEDSLILSRDLLKTAKEAILEQNFLAPSLFIRLNRDYLTKKSFIEVEEEILSLKSRIAHLYPQVSIKVYLDDIQGTRDQFESSRTMMLFLLVPIILLAAFFSYFTVEIVVRTRIREMALLRVRGAQSYQLIISFLLEFMVLTLPGLIVGIFLGRLVAALIPAATGFLLFDLTDFSKNHQNVPIPSIAWLVASLFCVGMVLVVLLSQIRRFLSIDISEAMGRFDVKRRTNRVGSLLMPERFRHFLPLVAGLFATFLTFLFIIDTGILTKYYGASRWRVALFAITLVFWIAFTATTARILAGILPAIRPVFRVFLSRTAILATRSLRRSQTQMLSLIIILTMTFSVGVFSLVNGETLGDNSERQLRYLVGSDFKIRTNPLTVPGDLFLAQEPGIAEVLPVFSSYGLAGDYVVSMIGVDPLLYSDMAIWDSASFSEPYSDHEYVLTSLAAAMNGIILNSFLAGLLGVGVGDVITIYQVGGELGINLGFEVVGIVRSLPGFGSAQNAFADVNVVAKSGGLVVLRNDVFATTLDISTTGFFLAKAQSDSNQRKTASRLRDNPDVLQVFAIAEIDELQEDLNKIRPLGIISVGFIVSAGVGLLSLTIFLGYLVGERKEEYAIMLSCGATRKQVTRLILGEFSGIVSFSFLIGSLMGIAFSWIYLKIAGSVISDQNVLPVTQVVPIYALILTCIAITLFMLIGTFFPARNASRCNVAATLRSQIV